MNESAIPSTATAAVTPAEDALAPGIVAEDESAAIQECWALSRRVVTKTALKRLGIRILDEGRWDGRETYLVSRLGYNRLQEHGYRFSNMRSSGTTGVMLADAERPDETAVAVPVAVAAPMAAPATAPVAPAVTQKDPAACVATVKTWFSDGGDTAKAKMVKLILDKLAPSVMQDIDIYVPHGAARQALTGPNFSVFIWSAEDPGVEDTQCPVPEMMWGIQPVTRDQGHFLPWATGTPITTDEGDEVGSFNKHNLYLYWDAVHSGKENEFKLMERFLTEAAKLIKEGVKIPSISDMRARYVGLCGKRHIMQVRQAEDEFKKSAAVVADLQRKLVETIRARERNEVLMHSAGAVGADADRHFANEFDAMRRMAKVAGVSFKGDNLVVETDPLYVVDPRSGATHEVGKMRISINTTTAVCRMMNMTRTVHGMQAGMQAPHVWAGGNGCLGSIDQTLPQLVAQYEYSSAVQLMIAYLESVNTDDQAGQHVAKWPTVDAAKVRAEQDARDKAKREAFEAEIAAEQATNNMPPMAAK